MRIKVILADDHKIVRQGLCSLLKVEADIEVVGEADSGSMALKLARELSPQVIIIDIAMPDINGIEATRLILAENPNIKVIALSMHSDSTIILEMLKTGASGYLLKDCALEELVKAIRAAMRHKIFLSPQVANILLHNLASSWVNPGAMAFSTLTAREREILKLMAEGSNTHNIATRLCISGKTVDTHRKRIMTKVGLNSVASLTKYAIRHGLTTLE